MPRKRLKKILKDVRIIFYVSGEIPDAYLHLQRSYLEPTLQGLEKWVKSQVEEGIEVMVTDTPFGSGQPKPEAVKAKIRAKALTPEARERSRQAAKKQHLKILQ